MRIRLGAGMADAPLTIDLSAVRFGDLPKLSGGFFAWWRDELVALMPWAKGRVGTTSREDVRLYLRRDRWFLKTPARIEPVAIDARLTDIELGERMLDAAGGAPLSRLTLVLPREHVLLRRLELPAMPDSYLRQAVELQIDRLSPFKADAVRYAARVVGRDPERHLVVVDAAIVPLLRITPVEQRLRALGFAVAAVDIEGENGEAEGFDLREPLSADDRVRRRNRNWMLAASAAVIWGLAIYAWNDAGAREAAGWQARIAELRPGAARSAALKRDLDAASARIVAANGSDRAAMLGILKELTHVLPDSARVVDLKVDGDTVEISGLAQSAPALIGLLEQSPLFADVKALSAFERRPDSGNERFSIAMRVEKGRAR